VAFRAPRTVVASAARTTTGNSGSITLDQLGEDMHLQVVVSAVSGTTPSATLTVAWSHDGVTFSTFDGAAEGFAAITATGNTIKSFPVRGPFYQVNWTITGTTPSLTFAITEFVTS